MLDHAGSRGGFSCLDLAENGVDFGDVDGYIGGDCSSGVGEQQPF